MAENGTPTEPSSSPMGLDAFVLVLGFALSGYLASFEKLNLAVPSAGGWLSVWVIRHWLMLPAGVVLAWPILHALQRLRGRTLRLTPVELCWGASWLIHLVWVAMIVVVPPPPVLPDEVQLLRRFFLAFMGAQAILSTCALILGSRTWWSACELPWTHRFGIVVLGWYAVPFTLYWLGLFQVL